MDNINFKKVLNNKELFDQQANYEDNFEKINQFVVPKITDLETNKVDKVTGKGLSTNDFDNTYKQKIDIDIPAQLADKVQNFKIKNDVLNGNFDSLVNWTAESAVSSVANNILTNTADGTAVYGRFSQNQPNLKPLNGEKFYYNYKIKPLNSDINSSRILFRNGTSSPLYEVSFTGFVNGQVKTISGVQAIASDFTLGLRLYLTHHYATNALATGKIAEFSKVIIVNLTKIFGAGNEPTKGQMDKLLSVYPNSWFDGTSEIGIDALMRATLGVQVVTPTLLNSRTGSAQYVVSNDGLVIFRGAANGGSLNTNIFVLPDNIRPAHTRVFPISANNAFGAITVAANGEVRQTVGALTNVFLDGIAFKVGV